jgi:hypothetical protein
MKLVTTNEAEVNAWYEEVQDVLGLSRGTDRGRVLKALRAAVREREELRREQSEVAEHYGYKKWGNLLNHVRNTKVGPSVELPPEFEKVPVGWFAGRGKPSYDECERKLRKAVQPLLLRWLTENPDTTESEMGNLIKAFLESESSDEIVQIIAEEYGSGQAEDKESEGRVSLSEVVRRFREPLSHFVTAEDLEWFSQYETTFPEYTLSQWEAAFVLGGSEACGVVRVAFEAAAFELAGFTGVTAEGSVEWRALQVAGELPQGDKFSEVLELGVPRSREGWLQVSALTT